MTPTRTCKLRGHYHDFTRCACGMGYCAQYWLDCCPACGMQRSDIPGAEREARLINEAYEMAREREWREAR